METWLWSLDADSHAETLFINPAKDFDCVDHDPLSPLTPSFHSRTCFI